MTVASPLRTRVEWELERLGARVDDRIGVACSGGADSVALLHLVAERRNVVVLHVDHGLRMGSADDAAFVASIADGLGLEHDCRTLDLRIGRGESAEAVMREARYGALAEMAAQNRVQFVLTAHTQDDQAETVLIRLLRGDPLDGIAPARDVFLRPLLGISRAELRAWLHAHGIAWREDPTNDDQRFERNWVRATLLPMLRERREGITRVLARTAERAADDGRALDALASAVLEDADIDDVGVFIPDIDLVPVAVRARVVRMACRRLGLDPRAVEIDSILALGRGCARCRDVEAWRIDGGLALLSSPVPTPHAVDLSGDEIASEAWGIKAHITITTPSRGLCIRSRRAGDRVRTRAGSRKVQDILVDAKVPRPLRGLVPVLACGAEAIAVLTSDDAVADSGRVLHVEPYRQTWSRKRAWVAG